MSATEILEQARTLPADELRKLAEDIQELKKTTLRRSTNSRTPPMRKPLAWPDAEARRRRIFGDRVLPNLVLESRDEEEY